MSALDVPAAALAEAIENSGLSITATQGLQRPGPIDAVLGTEVLGRLQEAGWSLVPVERAQRFMVMGGPGSTLIGARFADIEGALAAIEQDAVTLYGVAIGSAGWLITDYPWEPGQRWGPEFPPAVEAVGVWHHTGTGSDRFWWIGQLPAGSTEWRVNLGPLVGSVPCADEVSARTFGTSGVVECRSVGDWRPA